MAGRPTSLTPEVQAAICDALEKGNYRATAAAAAGVHRNTLINWEKWGEEGKAPYADFLTAMQMAEAKSEMQLLEDIRTARPGTPGVTGADVWTNRAWVLERRFASRWCQRVKQHVQEEVGQLTAKLKADPDLHKRVVDVLDQESSAPGTGAAH